MKQACHPRHRKREGPTRKRGRGRAQRDLAAAIPISASIIRADLRLPAVLGCALTNVCARREKRAHPFVTRADCECRLLRVARRGFVRLAKKKLATRIPDRADRQKSPFALTAKERTTHRGRPFKFAPGIHGGCLPFGEARGGGFARSEIPHPYRGLFPVAKVESFF